MRFGNVLSYTSKQIAYFIRRTHLSCGAQYLEQYGWSHKGLKENWKSLRTRAAPSDSFGDFVVSSYAFISFSLCKLAVLLLFACGAGMSALDLALSFKNPKETVI